MKHEKFFAMTQGKIDYTTPVIPIEDSKYGTLMCIMAEEGPIYITKQQAMEFFDLKDKPEISVKCDE